jgi:hypothetical protein
MSLRHYFTIAGSKTAPEMPNLSGIIRFGMRSRNGTSSQAKLSP